MKMRYPLLHKANGILLGLCFFIFDTPIVEGRWVYSEITTRECWTLERSKRLTCL
jgi:hypothetical protein